MVNSVDRVYLPTLVAPDLCYKLPIAVGYTCVAVGKVSGGGGADRQLVPILVRGCMGGCFFYVYSLADVLQYFSVFFYHRRGIPGTLDAGSFTQCAPCGAPACFNCRIIVFETMSKSIQ